MFIHHSHSAIKGTVTASLCRVLQCVRPFLSQHSHLTVKSACLRRNRAWSHLSSSKPKVHTRPTKDYQRHLFSVVLQYIATPPLLAGVCSDFDIDSIVYICLRWMFYILTLTWPHSLRACMLWPCHHAHAISGFAMIYYIRCPGDDERMHHNNKLHAI